MDFWASCLYYLSIYTVNLELNDDFKMIYDHIYLYIYDIYRSWVSCNWATYPEAISVKINTLVYFSSKAVLLMIMWPCGVVVACLLHTQEVPGSIPGRGSYLRQVSLH